MIRDVFNLMYVILYRFFYRMHVLSHFVNPLVWIYKIPFIHKWFQKRIKKNNQKDPIQITNELWGDPDNGFSTWEASAVLGISIVIYLSTSLSLVLSINNILSKYDIFMEVFYISAVITYIFIFHYLDSNNLQLKYIKKFDKMKIKTKYKIFTFMFITFSPIYGYLTLAYFISP